MQPRINAYLHDKEEMKPVPVSSPVANRLVFALRCVLDLQLKTIVDFLKPKLSVLEGNVLDVGAGNAPWKSYLPAGVQYVGLDVEEAEEFNMRHDPNIVYYSGGVFPFDDGTFTNVLCVEVLEHVPDTERLLDEISRCLNPGGQLLMTVPWSARRHHIPHDYFRFTPEALAMLLQKKGLENVQISERGNDYAVIFNKILCIERNLLFPKNKAWLPLTVPMGLMLLPSAILFLITAHLSMWCGLGSHVDPLGYAVAATKPMPISCPPQL